MKHCDSKTNVKEVRSESCLALKVLKLQIYSSNNNNNNIHTTTYVFNKIQFMTNLSVVL